MTSELICHYQERIEGVLTHILPSDAHTPLQQLHKAMRYSVLKGGKRVRPLLVYATGALLGVDNHILDIPAAAVELIHCYSLIHDDLPAMDNDDLRRGKPTCHKAFDEATAILAGDALQAEAFTILAQATELSAQQRISMLAQLGRACSSQGMAGGQAIDLAAVGNALTLAELEVMHSLKTGALIRASVLLGAIAGNADAHMFKRLSDFANALGLAFQIQDDILDVEGETAILGKQQGADKARGKPTYPAIIGMTAAKKLAADYYQQATDILAELGAEATTLQRVAAYIVQRDH